MNDFSRRFQERRRSIRIEEKLPFTIGHEGFEMEAVTVNLSSTGVMCRIKREITMMTQLAVALTLPGEGGRGRGKTVRMKGVVVRKEKDPVSDSYFIAIFFSDIRPDDRAYLEAFIHRRASAGD